LPAVGLTHINYTSALPKRANFMRSLSSERKILFGYPGEETVLGAGLFTFRHSKPSTEWYKYFGYIQGTFNHQSLPAHEAFQGTKKFL